MQYGALVIKIWRDFYYYLIANLPRESPSRTNPIIFAVRDWCDGFRSVVVQVADRVRVLRVEGGTRAVTCTDERTLL